MPPDDLESLERDWRLSVRGDFSAWCCEALTGAGQAPARHHRLMIRELERVASGEVPRLMILMPPGSAKSTYASHLFPAWYMAQHSRRSVIGASHTADLADSFSRKILAYVREHGETLGYQLTSEAATAWATTNGCEYKAAGVGGPITGRRADLAIIDDPVKSREDADSQGKRDRAWAWFAADLRTRLRPHAAIVLIMTRWHEDDLGGRILQTQPDLWRVLKLPAQATDGDPLGREMGEWLWTDDDYGYAAGLREVRSEYEKIGAMRDWSALFQQEPRPNEGALFKVAQISTIEAAPAGTLWARGWDLAATASLGTRDPDWTVGILLGRTKDSRYIVGDVVRLRGDPDEVEHAIVATAKRDGPEVRVGLPQDPGQAGKTQVLYLTRKLSGFRVTSSPETGDKATRAAPVASQVNVGNVSMLRAAWNHSLVDELAGFPSASKDDQVDALSRAFSMVGLGPGPLNIPDAALIYARLPGRR